MSDESQEHSVQNYQHVITHNDVLTVCVCVIDYNQLECNMAAVSLSVIIKCNYILM